MSGSTVLRALSLLFASLVIGCGKTRCPPGAAQILVGDGFMKILCGCTETSAIVMPPATLDCHLAARDSQVFVTFQGTLKHQIIPSVVNEFVPTPMYDPGASPVNSSAVLKFPSGPKTYGFTEVISGMQGRFFVP
jgi:hypothetical protein